MKSIPPWGAFCFCYRKNRAKKRQKRRKKARTYDKAPSQRGRRNKRYKDREKYRRDKPCRLSKLYFETVNAVARSLSAPEKIRRRNKFCKARREIRLRRTLLVAAGEFFHSKRSRTKFIRRISTYPPLRVGRKKGERKMFFFRLRGKNPCFSTFPLL